MRLAPTLQLWILSPLYLQRLEDATQQGIQRGQRLIIESMLQLKFGEVDEKLAQIIEPLMQLETLEATQMIIQLERGELLAHFSQKDSEES